jgi:hypothetical protein
MARYRDGLKHATHIFEAAAWQYAIKVRCRHCGHSAVFDPHAMWWLFDRNGWDDRLTEAARRFYCSACLNKRQCRVRQAQIDLVRESVTVQGLTMPDAASWKRALNRFRS